MWDVCPTKTNSPIFLPFLKYFTSLCLSLPCLASFNDVADTWNAGPCPRLAANPAWELMDGFSLCHGALTDSLCVGVLILPGAEMPWRMGCGSGWDPVRPQRSLVAAPRLCLQAGCRGRGQPGIPRGWEQQCQALGERANLWSAGAAVERLEMQRDGCCELGEGVREAVPSSSGCSETSSGKKGP